MNTENDVAKRIEQARMLDFGDIFNKSIELFKKTWVQGLLLQLFTLVVMLPLILIFYMPFINMIIEQQRNGYADPEAMDNFFNSMSVLYIAVVIVGVVILGVVTTALNAAFYRIMKKIDYNESVVTQDFFYFVKGKYLGKIFVLMLIAILIAIPSALMCYLPLFYFAVPLAFIFAIFAFNEELSVGQILSLSFKIGNKKWGITLGLLIVTYIGITLATLVTCGFGGIFVQSFLFHPVYLIYKEVVGFNEKSAIDEIGTISE
ncbi:hypothetical protein PK35_12240 [Tamlana nanhaiensis]|uniref:Glycerophosphoryl diester phosphodiesterase membrane domain-containing protein n=1 Tax=Neotamlana nanhaiensis TaxID=1382798 RepID=A0A0D7VZG0_9FLAO|nr:hypothetical protein [Tamlana nanhaiensis]KJD32194.1 hypothetical protein PK35_11355 [Tamlana nanhaiensis]KJD32356.1 hypothetical protein PK35_12240 [Tamlana nanhaiensis]